jgi:hypothetical protein
LRGGSTSAIPRPVADHEVGQDSTTSGGSLDAAGPDVLLRTVLPPYRLGELLLRIGELKLTGKLSLGSDMGRRAILFHSGFPVFTQSSLFAERLGAIGVRHGFFGREDVARALAHARDHQSGLGESLLELGYVDPQRLYALLGVQLREVVAASCGGSPQRARFQAGSSHLRDVAILRLHPLTAALAAVAALPASEQAKLLQSVHARKLSPVPLPSLARQWLTDLGYLGDAELLLNGAPAVSAIRERLLARQRADADKLFDPSQVPFSFAGSRVLVEPRAPSRVAELVTLTLLMTRAVRFTGPGGGERAASNELLANTAESFRVALEDTGDHPIADVRSGGAPGELPADTAIAAYLFGKRDRRVAGSAAVWGPSVEASDPGLPSPLLRAYLLWKPEKRPDVVLGIAAGASSEVVLQAYASRTQFVGSIALDSASEHLRCRAAELSQRFDDALDALLPGNGRTSVPPAHRASIPSPPASRASTRPPASRASVPPPAAGAAATVPSVPLVPPAPASHEPEPSPTGSRGDTRAAARSDALASKVDALLRAGRWRAVLEALEPHASDPKLPFTLQLARAMAQRELRGGRRPGVGGILLALVLGLALGYAARHIGGPLLPW